MNRRQFTASLGAVAAAPFLPVPALAAAAEPLPAGAYMWADFIARARGQVDAGFLARRLGLSATQAQTVMQELAARNVIRSAGLGGAVKATKPFRYPTNANRPFLARALDTGSRKPDTLRMRVDLDDIDDETPTVGSSAQTDPVNSGEETPDLP